MLGRLIEGMRALVAGQDETGTFEERRQRLRLRCYYPVVIRAEGAEFRSVVTDLGPAGLRVKFVQPLKEGAKVTITFEGSHPEYDRSTVHCQAVWCRTRKFSGDRVAGFAYDEPPEELNRSWVRFVLDTLGFRDGGAEPQRRRWIRAEWALPGLLEAEEFSGQVRVVNLGVGGALLQSDEELTDGQPAVVSIGPWEELPVLRLEGQLVGNREDPLLSVQLHRLEFTSLPPGKLELLGVYILKVLRETGDAT